MNDFSFQLAWWNYYQHQAYIAWCNHMNSIPTYQPLYTTDTWKMTTDDKMGLACCSDTIDNTENINQDLEEAIGKVNRRLDKLNSKNEKKEVEDMDEKELKKDQKKRERNRIRNRRRKEASKRVNTHIRFN